MPVASHHVLSFSHFKFLIRPQKNSQHIVYQNECSLFILFISRNSCSTVQSQTFGSNIFESVVLLNLPHSGIVMREVGHEQDFSDQVKGICTYNFHSALGHSPTIPMPGSVMRALLGLFPIGSMYKPCCSGVQEYLLSQK